LDAQSVKFNPLIQEKSYQNPKNPIFMNFWYRELGLKIELFWIFGVGYGLMFIHPSDKKSRKKFFLILSWTANFNAAFRSVDKVFSHV
jgi:hypothetical protein